MKRKILIKTHKVLSSFWDLSNILGKFLKDKDGRMRKTEKTDVSYSKIARD